MNEQPIDIATPVHFAAGYVMGQYLRPWQAVLISIVFEKAERWSKAKGHPIWIAPTQDTWINSTMDTVAVYAGSVVSSKRFV